MTEIKFSIIFHNVQISEIILTDASLKSSQMLICALIITSKLMLYVTNGLIEFSGPGVIVTTPI